MESNPTLIELHVLNNENKLYDKLHIPEKNKEILFSNQSREVYQLSIITEQFSKIVHLQLKHSEGIVKQLTYEITVFKGKKNTVYLFPQDKDTYQIDFYIQTYSECIDDKKIIIDIDSNQIEIPFEFIDQYRMKTVINLCGIPLNFSVIYPKVEFHIRENCTSYKKYKFCLYFLKNKYYLSIHSKENKSNVQQETYNIKDNFNNINEIF